MATLFSTKERGCSIYRKCNHCIYLCWGRFLGQPRRSLVRAWQYCTPIASFVASDTLSWIIGRIDNQRDIWPGYASSLPADTLYNFLKTLDFDTYSG